MISFLTALKKFYMHIISIFMSDLFIIFLDQSSDLYQLSHFDCSCKKF